jgi:hypothetical protein
VSFIPSGPKIARACEDAEALPRRAFQDRAQQDESEIAVFDRLPGSQDSGVAAIRRR